MLLLQCSMLTILSIMNHFIWQFGSFLFLNLPCGNWPWSWKCAQIQRKRATGSLIDSSVSDRFSNQINVGGRGQRSRELRSDILTVLSQYTFSLSTFTEEMHRLRHRKWSHTSACWRRVTLKEHFINLTCCIMFFSVAQEELSSLRKCHQLSNLCLGVEFKRRGC